MSVIIHYGAYLTQAEEELLLILKSIFLILLPLGIMSTLYTVRQFAAFFFIFT
jgi:hypothetical protein